MNRDLNEVLQDERLTVMGLLAETYASLSARNLAHLATFGMAGAEFESACGWPAPPRACCG